MHFVIISCFLLFITTTNCCKNFNSSEDAFSELIEAVSQVIRKSFLNKFTSINVISAKERKREESDFINMMLLRKGAGLAARLDSHKDILKISNRRKKNNIILLYDIRAFRVLNKNIEEGKFALSSYYLIVFPKGKYAEIEEIFATLWIKNIYNVAAIIGSADKSIEVMTFFPFRGTVCGDTTPVRINRFINGSFTNNLQSLFADKFTNLHNCALKISTFEDHFSIIKTKTANDSFELSGFDIELLRELSRALNFRLDIKLHDEPEPWGNVFENGTVSGALGEVANRKAHIVIGRCFLLAQRIQVADFSSVYFSFPEVFVVSPGREKTQFEKLLQPFDKTVWIFLLITVGAGRLMVLLLNSKLKVVEKNVRIRDPGMKVLAGALGVSQPKNPTENYSRFLLLIFLIFFLVLRNAYQGSLYKYLQSDERRDAIETIDEMVEQGFDLYLYESNLVIFENQPKILARFVHASFNLMFYNKILFAEQKFLRKMQKNLFITFRQHR